MMDKVFVVVYDLQMNFSSSTNLTSALLKEKISILRTIAILMSASKKVFSKN